MIDAKYGLKYPFPHVMTHIIDNSAYNGPVPVIYADDPSLFATLVVGAFPMGEDRKIVKLVSSDIPRVCYGLNNITQADRDKYGQVVDYPISLLSQGAPVQLLRVTPDDATYAFATILVSYKWNDDTDEPTLHVKFTTAYDAPAGSVLSNFKNPERLAQAIINQYSNSDATSDGWKTRVFAVVVSAGRGAVYNNMNLAIETIAQSKRPSNTRYSFSTIDSRTSSVIEEFVASLVNIDNNSETFTETVNNTVNQRTKGGSVLKPIINEKAVVEIFEEYKKHYKDELDSGNYITDSFVTNTYKVLNVNTFDLITGKYIYGGGLDTKLPFYQVDAVDPDIPRLAETYKLKTIYDAENPDKMVEVLEDTMVDAAYGILHNGFSVYIGDVYLSATGSRYTNPRISLVCGINQYTQAVTSVTFDSVYPLKTASDAISAVDFPTEYPWDEPAPVAIKKVYETAPTEAEFTADGIVAGDVYAVIQSSDVSADGFSLYTRGIGTDNADKAYTKEQLIAAIPYTTKVGMENIVAVYDGSEWILGKNKYSMGYTVIDRSTGKVYVNDYNIAENANDDNEVISNNRLEINDNSVKFGTPATTAGTASDIVGQSYDVLAYDDADVTKWVITNAPISSSQTGWELGDKAAYTVTEPEYTLVTTQPDDWATSYTNYYTKSGDDFVPVTGGSAPEWADDTYYSKADVIVYQLIFNVTGVNGDGEVTELTPVKNNASSSPEKITGTITLKKVVSNQGDAQPEVEITLTAADNAPYSVKANAVPNEIKRYIVTGIIGSLYKIAPAGVEIPDDYYSESYGINLSPEFGGVQLDMGNAGFLDDNTINDIVFKYKYAELLVKAFRGYMDPSITSPIRTPAKFLFDAGYNTVVGASFVTPMNHSVSDWINGSVNFTDDEKDSILYYPELIQSLKPADIDVKQAMYDLMIERVYENIPEDKRPIGPGSGFQVLFDSCLTDGATSVSINKSFSTRFTNPNASWDIGGLTTPSGYTYTFVKRSVDNLINHCKTYSVNKPFTGDYTAIAPNEYVSIFPDIDADEWEYRALLWNSGGNAWVPDANGYVKRMSQRTFYAEETSDLIWESNMRTLSQLTYLLKQKIEHYLFEYSDDSTLKTMKTECDSMFSNWVGDLVDELEINFERGLNTDGGDIVICTVRVVFRGLIIRVPIIVNVDRRTS